MLGDISKAEHIYLACGYTDMRKSMDGLATIVQQIFKQDPFSNSLFLFCGRKCNQLKAFYWEGDGFVLLYKCLEKFRFQWTRTTEEVCQLSEQEFRWLSDRIRKKNHRTRKRKPSSS